MALQAKVEAIIHAATPTDIGMLHSYLGLVEYYAMFIFNLAKEVESVHRLLCKDVHFEWDLSAKQSFTKEKELLASRRVLRLFNPALPVIVATDVSA